MPNDNFPQVPYVRKSALPTMTITIPMPKNVRPPAEEAPKAATR